MNCVPQKISYSLQENLARKFVFIDGITRCGKSLLTNILPSLTSVEHIQFITLLEMLIPGIALGSVDIEYARSMFRTYANEVAYNMKLGRSVNFRFDDQSGILNFKEPKTYFYRLSRPDGDEVVNELRRADHYFPFQTHNTMVNFEHFLKLEIDFYMIELFRNPVDNAYSWWTRGWGDRFGNDPRDFTLTLEKQGRRFPWHCLGYEEEWLKANPMERCIIASVDLIVKSLEQIKKAKKNERIILMRFEDFVENSDREIQRICDFLKIARTQMTDYFVQKARCPRKLDPADRQKKFDEFKSTVNSDILNRLAGLQEYYEDSFYDLKLE